MTSKNKTYSNESAVTVKRSRPINKARIIILAIVFAILAAGAIGFLSFHIKGWLLIPKMHHFEYRGVDKGTGDKNVVTTVYVMGIKCKHTMFSSFFNQKKHDGTLYLRDGSTLEITYLHVEPGRFELWVDGYKGYFEFHFDPNSKNRPAGV